MKPDTLISELTVSELQDLIRQTVAQTMKPERRILDGNHELADFLGCSESTVRRYKAAGVFRAACHQRGRTIVYDADKALECFGSHTIRR